MAFRSPRRRISESSLVASAGARRTMRQRDLPVQLPVRYPFILNLKTARAIGLDIPANVLALVDEVIE